METTHLLILPNLFYWYLSFRLNLLIIFPFFMCLRIETIDKCFSKDTVEEIITALVSLTLVFLSFHTALIGKHRTCSLHLLEKVLWSCKININVMLHNLLWFYVCAFNPWLHEAGVGERGNIEEFTKIKSAYWSFYIILLEDDIFQLQEVSVMLCSAVT